MDELEVDEGDVDQFTVRWLRDYSRSRSMLRSWTAPQGATDWRRALAAFTSSRQLDTLSVEPQAQPQRAAFADAEAEQQAQAPGIEAEPRRASAADVSRSVARVALELGAEQPVLEQRRVEVEPEAPLHGLSARDAGAGERGPERERSPARRAPNCARRGRGGQMYHHGGTS